MSVRRPALLPLLRSQNQLRLLAALLLAPTRRYTISELADVTGIPQPSVSREVANLLTTGVLTAGTDRRRKVVQANTDSVIFPELASLMLKTVGPRIILERALEGARNVDEAHIYGSWAARYAGEHGSEPNDIDLLVVGSPDLQDIQRRADHVKTSPLVTLDLGAGDVAGREFRVSP